MPEETRQGLHRGAFRQPGKRRCGPGCTPATVGPLFACREFPGSASSLSGSFARLQLAPKTGPLKSSCSRHGSTCAERSRFPEEQIMGILRQAGVGVRGQDLRRKRGVLAAAFCRAWAKHGCGVVAERQGFLPVFKATGQPPGDSPPSGRPRARRQPVLFALCLWAAWPRAFRR